VRTGTQAASLLPSHVGARRLDTLALLELILVLVLDRRSLRTGPGAHAGLLRAVLVLVLVLMLVLVLVALLASLAATVRLHRALGRAAAHASATPAAGATCVHGSCNSQRGCGDDQ